MDVRITRFLSRLIVLCSLAPLGCGDATEPGCYGLECRPVPGLVLSGSLVPPSEQLVAAIVHATFFDPTFGRDSLDRCAGSMIRDTVVLVSSATPFHMLLIAGFPVFQGCLVLRATPDAASGLQPTIISFTGLQLRDTSAHDTLYASIALHR